MILSYLDWCNFLVENLEFGWVLKVLVGYEVMLSKIVFWVYVIVSVVFIVLVCVLKVKYKKEFVCGF